MVEVTDINDIEEKIAIAKESKRCNYWFNWVNPWWLFFNKFFT